MQTCTSSSLGMQVKCPWSVMLWEATGEACLVSYGFPQRGREPVGSPVEGMALPSNTFRYFLCYLLLRGSCEGSLPVMFVQSTGGIPGEMSVAPSSSQPANNTTFWFCLYCSISITQNIPCFQFFFFKSCQYSK